MRQFFLLALLLASSLQASPSRYDVVVYGGTSGGVVAAVQAARSGKSVVLISPTKHLGGLTSSGLGWTDLGKSSILGGISREFYQNIYRHYSEAAAWKQQTRESFGNKGQGILAFDQASGTASVFEPKVAESVFDRWVAENRIEVVRSLLDLKNGIAMNGKAIRSLRLEDGREFAGKMFIDASYEGDLLPGAHVTYTVGRESNAAFGESVNGIQSVRSNQNQLQKNIDPFVRPGDPSSGLLPGVNPDPGGADGSGDAKLQAYCYRMVLTNVPENRVPVGRPNGYRESDYELVFRAIRAGQRGGFFKLSPVPNHKTDSNNTGGISTDLIGGNYGPGWDWTTLGHKEREALAKRHEQWQRGLIWTLQNHPSVPPEIRKTYASWGLPADEFADNSHWPWQLYVREARRMVSDVVMNQKNCVGQEVVPDSIGLAAYSMDSHHVQRTVKDGMVRNEGDIQLRVSWPYPVSYRSIVPKSGECTNLLVPWSLSASHMAFGSIRMEPVFMILSQSAAIAAAMAMDAGIPVQQVPYPELRKKLLAAGLVLAPPPRMVRHSADKSAEETPPQATAKP